jgi:formylglycine-generating enzyme required for sulfatase activity
LANLKLPNVVLGTVECSILPLGSHRVGAREDDRFANEAERPLYEVTFSCAVGIDCDPVTEVAYQKFPPGASDSSALLPEVNVSWDEACSYCYWLERRTGHSSRLPSEAEREVACRAGTETPFATRNALAAEQANYNYDESGERIGASARSPVGSHPGIDWGIRDMHGNVCEWCADAWSPTYEGAASDGSPRLDSAQAMRVIRGGPWDILPRLCRSSWRDGLPAHTRRDNVGFRLAVTLTTTCS